MHATYPGGEIVTRELIRNVINLSIWFGLFAAIGFAWTGSGPVALITGGTGVLVVAALSIRISVDR
jgi:hypothetical protein